MRLIGLLSWYDEPEERLAACVSSFAPLLDELVALDGAYADWPHDELLSPTAQREAIQSAADGLRCDVLSMPTWRWANQVEKRAALFELGHAQADPCEDWFMVIDADMRLLEGDDLHSILAGSGYDCAGSTLVEGTHVKGMTHVRRRKWKNLFRAIPGLTVRGHHGGYVLPDGRVLWNGFYGMQEQGLETGVVIAHEQDDRPARVEYKLRRTEEALVVGPSRRTYSVVADYDAEQHDTPDRVSHVTRVGGRQDA